MIAALDVPSKFHFILWVPSSTFIYKYTRIFIYTLSPSCCYTPRPHSTDQLRNVPGLTSVQVTVFGPALVDVIIAFCSKHPLLQPCPLLNESAVGSAPSGGTDPSKQNLSPTSCNTGLGGASIATEAVVRLSTLGKQVLRLFHEASRTCSRIYENFASQRWISVFSPSAPLLFHSSFHDVHTRGSLCLPSDDGYLSVWPLSLRTSPRPPSRCIFLPGCAWSELWRLGPKAFSPH